MQLLPAPRSRLSQRVATEILRSPQMRRARLQALRLALHLDRIPIRNPRPRKRRARHHRRRTRPSPPAPAPSSSPSASSSPKPSPPPASTVTAPLTSSPPSTSNTTSASPEFFPRACLQQSSQVFPRHHRRLAIMLPIQDSHLAPQSLLLHFQHSHLRPRRHHQHPL